MSGASTAESFTFTTASLSKDLPSGSIRKVPILLELAGEAIVEAGASPAEPIHIRRRNRYPPEYDFRGKSSQHKSHYALMAAAMFRAGVYPDLVDEAHG